MKRPWMPLYIADYRADTTRLSTLEHGAYLLLIMEYWHAGGLPDNDAQLARIVGLSPLQWKKVRPTVAAFFGDGWKHKRIDEEIAHAAEVSDRRRASAQQRHSKPDANASANAPPKAGANADTLHTSHSVPNGTGEPPSDPKAELFKRARQVLGPKQGGSITAKLLKSHGNEDDPNVIAKVRARIEEASTKAQPAEWLGRVMAGPARATTPDGQLFPEGIV